MKLLIAYLSVTFLFTIAGGFIAATDWQRNFDEVDLFAVILGTIVGFSAGLIWPATLSGILLAFLIKSTVKRTDNQ